MSKKHQTCDFCGDYGVAIVQTKLEPYSEGKTLNIGCACVCQAFRAVELRKRGYYSLDDMRKKYSDMVVVERISEKQAYAEAMADKDRVKKMNRFVEQQAGKKGI